jgi:hypothetical protein
MGVEASACSIATVSRAAVELRGAIELSDWAKTR